MNTKIPHMETIKNTAKLFGLSEYFIRQKVLCGEIVSVKTGNKYLVNIDRFADYLNTHTEPGDTQAETMAVGIQPIKI